MGSFIRAQRAPTWGEGRGGEVAQLEAPGPGEGLLRGFWTPQNRKINIFIRAQRALTWGEGRGGEVAIFLRK